MALTRIYTIAPNPHWVIIDNFSKLPDGAAIYTYRALDPSTFKAAFQDAAGTIPYGQPILGFGNGTMPPIFWEFDPNNPTDTYYIRVYDKENTPGNGAQFLWDFNGLSGGGSGGGGTVITATDLDNLVTNNVFYRNTGDQAGTPSLPLAVTLAPSNFSGFVGPAATLTGGFPSPDITFQKSHAVNSDSLSYIPFTPLGTNDLSNDVTPEIYLEYACTTSNAGETYKFVQFPISKGVQNLSQQTVTVKIYAQCNSGDPTLKLFWRQFYGDGGGTAEQIVQIGADIALTSSWKAYTFNGVIVPDATGQTLGGCGNDGLFLLVSFPLNIATNIDFIKPAVYLGGTVAPGTDYASDDEIDSIISLPRTGDVRICLNSFQPGWVIMNDGVISTAGVFVLPVGIPAARRNIDTFPLFDLIWRTFQGNQALAPMFNAGGGPVPYGASSIADFIAPNQLQLTQAVARVMAGISGSHLLGTTIGTENNTLTTANLPNTDGVSAITGYLAQAAPGVFALQGAGGNSLKNIAPGGTAFNILQPTVYMNFFIKL